MLGKHEFPISTGEEANLHFLGEFSSRQVKNLCFSNAKP